jgi:imidazolonepropionase-like amidohydrolase
MRLYNHEFIDVSSRRYNSGVLALTGGIIYPDPAAAPIVDGVVLLRGDRVEAVGSRVEIPPGADRLDCAGLAVCAGFWNCHVHFFERKWANAAALPAGELAAQLAQMLTRYGFTTVFDTGSQWENTRAIRDRIEAGEVPGPSIRSTGEGLLPAGGAPGDTVLAMMGVFQVAMPEVSTPEEAASAARERLAAGTDAIKIFVSSPRVAPLPEAVIAAAVEEAHRAGKPAFAHPNSAADVLAAARAGVDIIAHTTPHSGPWDDALLRAMSDGRTALTPTLTLWEHYLRHDRLSTQQRTVETALGQLRAWRAAGGEVLFGTDLGAVEYDPAPEYRLMAAAGMGFSSILESLTTAPARRFGDTVGGRIAPGMRADLVAFDGEFSRVRYTIRRGRVIFP